MDGYFCYSDSIYSHKTWVFTDSQMRNSNGRVERIIAQGWPSVGRADGDMGLGSPLSLPEPSFLIVNSYLKNNLSGSK